MSAPANSFKAYLAQELEAGTAESTILLDRITTLDGQTIETSDFADLGRGIITVNPQGDGRTSYPENISFTGVNSATLGLTGAVRGLSKLGVTTTGLMRYHPVGTPVIMSFGNHNIQDLLNYIDAEIAAVAIGTANVSVGTAGETFSQGALVYLKNDGKWWKADADDIATMGPTVQLGIAQGAGTADASISGGVMLRGLDTHQSGLVAGTDYYASNTAGGISSSVGTNTRLIGRARSSTSIYVDFSHPALAIQNNSFIYAADSVGSDSYAISPTPAIGSYVAGQIFHFKAGTANTGAATLAVSGLAAKTIKKAVSSDLETGDILQNQIITVIYDGTNFQLISKTGKTFVTGSVYASGSASKNLADANGATQTIAHGLGVAPKKVRFKIVHANSSCNSYSEGVWMNGTYSAVFELEYGDTSDAEVETSTSYIIRIIELGGGSAYQTATITVDATNINLTWAKSNNPSGTKTFLWEAEGETTSI